MTTLVAGTRGSDLALWQTRHVLGRLRQAAPGVTFEERLITTRGDVDMSERLVGKLEKGFFTEELEAALCDGRIDVAVHSLKDLPTRMPKGLALGAVLTRHKPVDVLIAKPEAVADRGPALLPLREGATVGASSLRRDAMVRRYGGGLKPMPLRGNVPTRVQRLREGKADAILLAAAGVERLALDLSGLRKFELNPRRWMTAPGQGAVAVECRAGDARVQGLLAPLHYADTAGAVEWERAFLRVLEGGCATPFGCYVESGRAYFGQAVESGWKSGSVVLPAGLDETARDAFIVRVLEDKERLDADDDSWLHRAV